MAANLNLTSDLQASIDWDSQQSHLLLNPHLEAEARETLLQLAHRFPQTSTVWIASSGSSKKSDESLKLIALTKTAMKASSRAVNEHLQARAQDVWLQALPRFHVGGLQIELRAHLSGSKVVTMLQAWNPNEFTEFAQLHGATLSALVPTQIHDLVRAGLSAPKSLRAIVIGGAALDPHLYHKACRLGWPLLPSFGLTEGGSQVATAELSSLQQEEFPKLRLLNHCEAQVNPEGFLKIAGPSLLTGYAQRVSGRDLWQAQESSWWTTSDRVELHYEADAVFLRPVGRESEFVKINGEGVQLLKLRERLAILMQENFSENTSEVVLLDLPHARQGRELVLAHSQKLSNELAGKILELFNLQVSSIEKMKRLVPVASIPRTALGKVQWEDLRASCTI